MHTQPPSRAAILSALALVALALTPRSAHAQAPAPPTSAQTSTVGTNADEADAAFRLGNEAYKRRDYRAALAHYFTSNRLAPNYRVLFNIARCYESLSEPVQAYRYYSAFAQQATKDAERQAASAALDRVKDQVALLEITSTPPGATIYLNRKNLGSYGVTPQVLAVEPGAYTVLFEREGYRSASSAPQQIKRGQRVAIKQALEPREGLIRLDGRGEVTLKIDAQPEARVTLPHEVTLPLGEHVFRVRRPGFAQATLRGEAVEGRETTLSVRLQRQTAALVVRVNEANAAVLLDGKLVGFAPIVLNQVPVGEHELEIRAEGFSPERRTLRLRPNAREELDVELRAGDEIAAASRVLETTAEAPASVSLISLQELRGFAYTGTADALTGTRGIYFSSDDNYTLPGLRGYAPFGQYGNRLLVQIDGHTLNENWIGASFQQYELLTDLYGLERIEVARGPGSVLYGSGAFFGVINLVSADPTSYSPTRIGVTALEDGMARGYAHVRQRFKDGGVQLSAGMIHAQPRDYTSQAYVGSAEAPDGTARGAGEMTAATARAKIRWKDLTLHAHWHQRDKGVRTGAFQTIFGDPRTRQADRRGYVDLRWQKQVSARVALNARAFYDYYGYEGDFAYTEAQGGLYQERYAGHWAGAELRASSRLWTGARLDAGAEGKRHFTSRIDATSALSAEQSFTLSFPYSTGSIFAILRQEIGEDLSMSLGGRLDAWLYDGLPDAQGAGDEARTITNANPRLALIWRPGAEDKTIFKLLGGRAFRAPSIYELTYNDGGLTQIPSPQLEPETIYTGELEVTQRLPRDLSLTGSLYTNRIGNRIEQVGGGSMADPLRYINATSQLWTVGAELELRRVFRNGWMLAAQYAFQRTREGGFSDAFTSDTPIPNSPAHMASLKTIIPVVGRSTTLASRFSFLSAPDDRDGNTLDPALIVDLAISGRVPSLPFTYALGARNLLDWRAPMPVGEALRDRAIPNSGRTFMLDVAAEF